MRIHHISLANVHRMLMGDVGWSFALEVVFRAGFMYLALLIFMRLMGKRLAAGLSITELAVILTLGAAAGMPMQSVKQGLLPSAVVLFVGLVFQQGLARLSFWSRRLELISLGDVVPLLKEGRLLMDELHRAQLSNDKLFAALRAQGIYHLGQLRRVYLEASGQFSVILYREQRPGLSIMPEGGDPLVGLERVAERRACRRCGYCPGDEVLPSVCPHCRSRERQDATVLRTSTGARQATAADREPSAQAGAKPG